MTIKNDNNLFSVDPQALSGQNGLLPQLQDNSSTDVCPPESPENAKTNTVLQAALEYAQDKKPVFPCNPENKKPLTSKGFKDASTDAEQIKSWWKRNPQPMIGMVTGDASGLLVIDCDEDGVEQFEALCAEHEYTPETLQAKTKRGYHLYYQMPTGKDIPCSASKLAPHVDVRANGGYVIAPPSCRSDGIIYTWVDPAIMPAKAPDWLVADLEALQSRAAPQEVPVSPSDTEIGICINEEDHQPYVKAAIKNECEKVAKAQIGTRNTTLFSASCRLAEFVAGGVANEDAVREALIKAAEECGLIPDDGMGSALSTIKSGFDRGKKNPRGIPEKRNTLEKGTLSGVNNSDGEKILPPPPPVPLEAFHPKIQELIQEVALAFSVPPEVVVACLLAVVSCMVGRSRAIQAKVGWLEYANLWILLVASSGMGKTPVANAIFRPINEMEYALFEQWKRDFEYYEMQMAAYKRSKGEDRGEKPVPPIRKQLYVNDTTIEAVADALESNPRGILVKSDEMSGTLAEFDKYTNSGKVGATKARLMSSYDCEPWKTNRRDIAKNKYIPAACVSIFGGIQPKMLKRVFDTSDQASGFLQRILFIRAERDAPALWSETTLSDGANAVLQKMVNHLSSFQLRETETGLQPYVVLLSKGAKAAYVECLIP